MVKKQFVGFYGMKSGKKEPKSVVDYNKEHKANIILESNESLKNLQSLFEI